MVDDGFEVSVSDMALCGGREVTAVGGDDWHPRRTAAVAEVATASKQVVKRVLFPGMDVHARSRYRHISPLLTAGDVDTLDAGCGNGMLAYAAYCRGNRVVGVTLDNGQVRRNSRFYQSMGIEASRLRFEQLNLYDLPRLGEGCFDQVICSEALEHIADDARIVRYFAQVLRPGGVLHLCCPNAEHPEHALGRVDEPEDGRHVRDGYTRESYAALLEPAGFEIEATVGIGSNLLVGADRIVRRVRHRLGHAVAAPLLALAAPVCAFDRTDPPCPFSIYVRARRH